MKQEVRYGTVKFGVVKMNMDTTVVDCSCFHCYSLIGAIVVVIVW